MCKSVRGERRVRLIVDLRQDFKRLRTEKERSLSQLLTGTVKKIDNKVNKLGKTSLKFLQAKRL
jgi:hypothetical protein